ASRNRPPSENESGVTLTTPITTGGSSSTSRVSRRGRTIVCAVPDPPLSLIEFPADDAERARRFWEGLLGVSLEARRESEGEGWQTHSGAPPVGVHPRGPGPG